MAMPLVTTSWSVMSFFGTQIIVTRYKIREIFQDIHGFFVCASVRRLLQRRKQVKRLIAAIVGRRIITTKAGTLYFLPVN
jgi:hypothetical protein